MTEKDLLIYAVMLLDEATCDLIDANTPDNLVEAINSMCKSVVRGVIRITGLRPADVGLEAYESALS